MQTNNRAWLGLMIGNSRWHWAWFRGDRLYQSWDTPHLSAVLLEQLITSSFQGGVWTELASVDPQALPGLDNAPVEICLASVVPSQTELWKPYSNLALLNLVVLKLEQIPIQDLYATIGIDRALALLGAGATRGWPILVIDCGTALTLTAANQQQQFVGGAILPGIKLQFQALAQNTAALPLSHLSERHSLPQRWAMTTSAAIRSGITYTTLAGIRDYVEDWWSTYPQSTVVLTGGDSRLLSASLQAQAPAIAQHCQVDAQLIFWGMRAARQSR
ncbi:MAG: pantothenate kinase [Cyanothece sp. SIO1E1]|nr:pantothenate kinase [Cyanothece sp. SIO1E1]